jgi:hypothetical protein
MGSVAPPHSRSLMRAITWSYMRGQPNVLRRYPASSQFRQTNRDWRFQQRGRNSEHSEQVNAIGRMDAVIHNASIYSEGSRGSPRRRACCYTRCGHSGTLHFDRIDRAARSAALPEQRSPSFRQGAPAGHRLERAPLGRSPGLCRKQAVRYGACFCPGAALAGSPKQRRRSGVGEDQNGRAKRAGGH